MMKKQMTLKYFLSETHYFERDYSILVVTLVGPLTEQNIPTFHQCVEQIAKSSAKWIIINFRDVPNESDSSLIPCLQNLVRVVHSRPSGLRIAGLHPKLREALLKEGLTQVGEISNNFAEALESLPHSH